MEILLLGNPKLRVKSEYITDFNCVETKESCKILKESLEEFREKHKFGRGIAAIQIGIPKRIIALNLGNGTFVIMNPTIIKRSTEKFMLWDDCMSFPDLAVKVERNCSIDLEFYDEAGVKKVWENLSQDVSELLQHEIDHLDGILAIDRVESTKDILYKSELNKK